MKRDFVENGKKEMNDFVIKAIDDLLKVLNSKIEYPKNLYGVIMEHKLISCVKAREQIYIDLCDLMDKINIDNADKKYKNKIIEGLETTWHELTKITVWDIGNYEFGVNANNESFINEEEKKKMAMESVADNIKASVSSAKKLSAILAYQILDRIEKLENPDKINEEILRNSQGSNIIEEFVEN